MSFDSLIHIFCGTGTCSNAKRVALWCVLVVLAAAESTAVGGQTKTHGAGQMPVPPRVAQAGRFLAGRGMGPGSGAVRPLYAESPADRAKPMDQGAGTAAWAQFGPSAVQTPGYGLVTGRVTALALDPSDVTGNRLYLGTTGGGVWVSGNAGAQNTANIVFTPLTDDAAVFAKGLEASLSIGALAVQPGGTGVVLAGTGDPNDVMDSYYGAGILRSADGGTTWSLIQNTADNLFSFVGEGIAGIAFSTKTPQLVVAAVSQAWEGVEVDAELPGISYEGLYYSTDGGASWTLATIRDGTSDVQGMGDLYVGPNGNAATSVVWNPVRQVFMAAVRFHGYYQSADGITWTRLTAQPGANLTSGRCPVNPGSIGSTGCPIYRGTLAVNPATGDTFAWTVDVNLQDQGIWQDQCGVSANQCTNQISFGKQWNTAALESNTALGASTIANGDYDLALASVPSQAGAGADTVLLAGGNDLWECSLAMGCAWRNATNFDTCMSAKVAGYQHAMAWNASNPLEIFVGNDGGIWRSTDGIAETGSSCSPADAAHFQNLNGGLGSLAEVEELAVAASNPYTVLAGLGTNGAAGTKSSSAAEGVWPQVLGGAGGPVAIDPANGSRWFVNNQAGVSIYECTASATCAPGDFGSTPVVSNADVGEDGLAMPTAAPFLVDPLDETQLLVGTCRVWRGAANGAAWSASNAISKILDGGLGGYCSGDALIRSMAALPTSATSEVVYVGMYGAANGGGTLAGHVLRGVVTEGGGMPVWSDLTLNPVSNDGHGLNYYGLDVSSIAIDPHDATGNTVYVTVAGFPSQAEAVRVVYRSTDGGGRWAYITSNLPAAPANGLAVDAQDGCTVYIATDLGVWSTRNVASCAGSGASCWAPFGDGLPMAPVTTLNAAPSTAQAQLLTAGTYGRGIWQTPQWTAGTALTTATLSPGSWSFPAVPGSGGSSGPQPFTVTNTGTAALTIGTVSVAGDSADFTTTGCQGATLEAGGSCTVEVTFSPTGAGARTGTLTVAGNLSCQGLTASLSGTGVAPPLEVDPTSIDFGGEPVRGTTAAWPVSVTNTTASAITFTAPISVSGAFVLSADVCSGKPLAAGAACGLGVEFSPTQAGAASGTLTIAYQSGSLTGTRTVGLSGTGEALATDTLSASSLSFSPTVEGQLSARQTVTLTNSGGVTLTGIEVSASAGYQVSSNCGTALAAQSSCTIGVNFDPMVVGSEPGTLTIEDAARTQTVALSGTGLQPPVLGVLPATLVFATQNVGQTSAAQALTVSNTGGAPLANVGFQLTGQSAGAFATGATTCGAVLNAGSTCTVAVTFSPRVGGGSSAALVVSSSTNGVATAQVALSGTGAVPGGLTVSPAQLSFAVVAPGQTSAAQTVNITNTGTAAVVAVNLAVTAPFGVVQNGCAGSLGAGASCSAGIVFAPAVQGAFSGSLTVSAPSLSTPAVVTLSGMGGTPGMLTAQPGSLSFPLTGVGAASSAMTVTLTNPAGAAALTGLRVGTTGPFNVASTTCSGTLGSGASCTVGLVFAPSSAGAQSGNLTESSDQIAAGNVLPLAGMGFDFTVTNTGAAGQTVSNGGTAQFTLSLALTSQSQNAVLSVACNTAASTFPPHATCNFSPSASPSVPWAASGSVAVQVATGQTQSAEVRRGPGLWPAAPVLCGLLLLPFARRGRGALLLWTLLLAAAGVTSCTSSSVISGGGPTGGGAGSTPAGTYYVPIVVSGNNVQHTLTVTVVVE